jgi:hypothetical protein
MTNRPGSWERWISSWQRSEDAVNRDSLEKFIYPFFHFKLLFMKRLVLMRSLIAFLFFTVLFSACKKQQENAAPTASPTTTADDKIIITPFGPRPASEVHLVDEGYKLSYDPNGHLQQIHVASGKRVRDFGLQLPGRGSSAAQSAFDAHRSIIASPTPQPSTGHTIVPTLGSGWITDVFWQNFSGVPINYFTTSWTVPAAPYNNDGQLLYVFNGLQDFFGTNGTTGHIFQPVLQYGNNGSFGGNFWTIDNWYASCATCAAFHGTAVQVLPNTPLQGVIQQTGAAGGLFSYTSFFTGYPASNSYQVTNVPELNEAVETMEAYNMQYPADYPPNGPTAMTGIQILTNNVNAGITWTVENHITDVGQHTILISNASPGGEVDLYYRNIPVITGLSELGLMPSGYVQATWSYSPLPPLVLSSFNVSLTNYRTGANVMRTGLSPSLHLTVQPPTGTIRGDQVAVTIYAVHSNGSVSTGSSTVVITVN